MSKNIGKIGEAFVASILLRSGMFVSFNKDKGKLAEYDIECTYKTCKFTCEVKYDRKCCETGNLVLEYKNSRQNKASGILSTRADVWVFVVMDSGKLTAWACGFDKLIDYVLNNEPARIVKRGGDSNSDFYLYKFSSIKKILKRIDNVAPASVRNILLAEAKCYD